MEKYFITTRENKSKISLILFFDVKKKKNSKNKRKYSIYYYYYYYVLLLLIDFKINIKTHLQRYHIIMF